MEKDNNKSDFEVYIEKLYPNFMYILNDNEINELKLMYGIYLHWKNAVIKTYDDQNYNDLKIYETYMKNADYQVFEKIEDLKFKHKDQLFFERSKN